MKLFKILVIVFFSNLNLFAMEFIVDSNGNTALHLAAKAGDMDALRNNIDQINVRNKAQDTPLHVAVRAKQEEAVNYLLENNADVNAISNSGTPLDIACKQRNMQMHEVLFKKGAKRKDHLESSEDNNKPVPKIKPSRSNRWKLLSVMGGGAAVLGGLVFHIVRAKIKKSRAAEAKAQAVKQK